ncbi:MAG TPA: hypothetical protein P5092_15895 [Ruminococcus sp.]|nr:hypothetical protein [Ruminococcus sp.]
MKKYIIITYVIGNMGGAQMYCLNKYKFCKQKGYQVFLFPSEFRPNIYINELESCSEKPFEEFSYPPRCYSKRSIRSIISRFLRIIDYKKEDEIIIESHTVNTAQWGEILSEEVHGKNFIFLLAENIETQCIDELSFLRYKYSHRHLSCITKETMQKLFSDLSLEDCIGLGAICGNTVQDVNVPKEIEKLNIKETDIVIGIVGRLTKPYVSVGLKKVIETSKKHLNKQFKVIIIGGAIEDTAEQELYNMVRDQTNVSVFITGFIYPIPLNLLKLSQVCLSSAGSANAIYQYVPTISIDAYTYEAIGVLGYNTDSTLTKNNSFTSSIEEYLENILFGNFLNSHDFYIIPEKSFDEKTVNQRLDEHLRFVDNMRQADYYNFERKCSIKERLIKTLYSIGGIELINKLRSIH